MTEAYIKARYDYGAGKCAVVMVHNGEITDEHVWAVSQPFRHRGVMIAPDQFNCEILAAIWAVRWCRTYGIKDLRIITNTMSSTLWYGKRTFPEGRVLAKTYCNEVLGMKVSAEYLPKSSHNEYNKRMNHLANVI